MSDKQSEFKDLRPNVEGVLESISENRTPLVLVLDQVHDIGNIGAIFRLADAVRAEKVIMYQCDFDRASKKFKRASRQTYRWVEYQRIDDIDVLKSMKKAYDFIALDKTSHSIHYADLKIQRPIALVIGNEKQGISQPMLDLCEKAIHLPMLGFNISINVATATAVAVYEILRKI